MAYRLQDIIDQLEQIAPLALQEDYDNSGLQCGDREQTITKVLVTLDVTEAIVEEAIGSGAQLIVCHHPLLFRPLRNITPADYIGRTLIKAIQANIAIYAAHTNLDNAAGGVSYIMAEKLHLTQIKPLAPLSPKQTASLTADVATQCGSGVIGKLPQAMTEDAFLALTKQTFKAKCLRHNLTGKTIERVALCGGSGSSFIKYAISQGADAFVTGEVGYHPFFGQPELLIVEAGHYETEQYTVQLLCDIITTHCPDIACCIAQHCANPIVTD